MILSKNIRANACPCTRIEENIFFWGGGKAGYVICDNKKINGIRMNEYTTKKTWNKWNWYFQQQQKCRIIDNWEEITEKTVIFYEIRTESTFCSLVDWLDDWYELGDILSIFNNFSLWSVTWLAFHTIKVGAEHQYLKREELGGKIGNHPPSFVRYDTKYVMACKDKSFQSYLLDREISFGHYPSPHLVSRKRGDRVAGGRTNIRELPQKPIMS